MNKNIKLSLYLIHMEALRHSEENTDRTIVFKIYRTLNLINKKN